MIVAVAEVVKVNDVVSVAVTTDEEIVEVSESVVDDAELVLSTEADSVVVDDTRGSLLRCQWSPIWKAPQSRTLSYW